LQSAIFKFLLLRHVKVDLNVKMDMFYLQNVKDKVLKKGEYIPIMRSYSILNPENYKHCKISVNEKGEFL